MEPELTIGRLRSTYLVPRDHPAPELLRRRLDQTARARLEAACEAAFARALDPSDRSLWFVRELELEMTLDAAMEPARIAEFWASRIAVRTAGILAAGPDSDRVVRFEGMDEYVTAFVADLAAGKAASRWYYRDFDSLSVLSPSAAIRTVLTRAPGLASRVLRKLHTSRRLEPVLESLRPADAQLLVESCAAAAAAPDAAYVLESLYRLEQSRPLDTPYNLLRLYAWQQADGGAVAPAILEAAELCRVDSRVVAFLIAGDWASIAAAAQNAGRPELAASCPAAREMLGSRVARLAPVETIAPGRCERLRTRYGGAFLLLEALVDSTPPELLESPQFRARVLAAALGAGREILTDPAFRRIAGLDDRIEHTPLPDAADAIVRRLLARGRIDGRSLVVQPVDDLLIAADSRSGEWIAAVDAARGTDDALDRARSRTHVVPEEVRSGAPASFGDETDEAIVLAAHAVLRAFASSLPGFHGSSTAHLRSNFLCAAATVEGSDITIHDVPLSLVLRMGGYHQREIAVSWLDFVPRLLLAEA